MSSVGETFGVALGAVGVAVTDGFGVGVGVPIILVLPMLALAFGLGLGLGLGFGVGDGVLIFVLRLKLVLTLKFELLVILMLLVPTLRLVFRFKSGGLVLTFLTFLLFDESSLRKSQTSPRTKASNVIVPKIVRATILPVFGFGGSG